jgi:hypothetical protein
MDHLHYVQQEMYFRYRAKELQQRGEAERLARTIEKRRVRFYYPAMARFGHWLIVYGRRLQRRYGDLCDLAPSRPARHRT